MVQQGKAQRKHQGEAVQGEQGHDDCLLNNDARPNNSRTEKKLSDLRQKLSYLKKESALHSDSFVGTASPGQTGRAMADSAAVGRSEGLKARSDKFKGSKEFLLDLGGVMLPYLKDLSTPEAAGSQGTSMDGIFPIPLPPGKWTLGGEKHEEWGEGIIRSLNWLATGSFAVGKGVPTRQQIRLVDHEIV